MVHAAAQSRGVTILHIDCPLAKRTLASLDPHQADCAYVSGPHITAKAMHSSRSQEAGFMRVGERNCAGRPVDTGQGLRNHYAPVA